MIFGNGPMPNVHLTLDIEEWSGVSNTNFLLGDNTWKIEQNGLLDHSLLTIGDQLYVENEGTGNSNFGIKLEDRIQDDNPLNNTIILPIVRELWDSRDDDGRLDGRIEVVDFVGVHLDRRQEVVVNAHGNAHVVETLVGHVVQTTAHGVVSLEPGGYSEGLFTPILLR